MLPRLIVLIWFPLAVACNKATFAGTSKKQEPPKSANDISVSSAPDNPLATQVTTTTVTKATTKRKCSQSYLVPATANPFLAGASKDAVLTYKLGSSDPNTPTDTVLTAAPVLVTPTDKGCITAGKLLYFEVSGGISASSAGSRANADGDIFTIVNHQLGPVGGKSDIKAPIDALVGVFLSEADSTNQQSPETLDFSSPLARNYQQLSPKIGQIFFIVPGRTAAGGYHSVVVPEGATRLYFGTMDGYQWNNNVGDISGAILVGQ